MRRTLLVAALLIPAAVSAQTSKPAQSPPAPARQISITLDGEPSAETTTTQTLITSEMLQAIPFESRFAFAAMLLAPGVSPNSFSAYGSGGETSHAYLLDGAPVNDPETGATW